jgi:hypothetical protein
LKCENPRHKQHLKRFLKKYPTADKNGEFAIITVNSEDWAIDLEHPEKNTVKCCQMCSIQEDYSRQIAGKASAEVRRVKSLTEKEKKVLLDHVSIA